jgi:hypothetical protein
LTVRARLTNAKTKLRSSAKAGSDEAGIERPNTLGHEHEVSLCSVGLRETKEIGEEK